MERYIFEEKVHKVHGIMILTYIINTQFKYNLSKFIISCHVLPSNANLYEALVMALCVECNRVK